MGVADWFSQFNKNLVITNTSDISYRYKRITKAANQHFWFTDSETAHSWYVGSYGRNTGIDGISDLDVLFQMPSNIYTQYDNYSGNGQSAFLQAFKKAVQSTYPQSDVGADGQIVAVNFSDGITFEVLPCFLKSDGSYTFADTNEGGKWRTTNPFPEMEAIRSRNIICNYNLIRLCRMMRAWKIKNAVNISGMLIDTIAYQFIDNWPHKDKSFLYYDFMSRDFFDWLASQRSDQYYWLAPGSGQWVYGSGFQYKARQAYNKSIAAINYQSQYEWSAKNTWREIYGTSFPS